MYSLYHSQFGEDQFLEARGLLPSSGVFVDVGAGHPITFSNTYRLEKRGWTGLCVDADPRQIELLKVERKCVEHYAIARNKKFIQLHRVGAAELSTTLDHLSPRGDRESTIFIPAIDLESLLVKHGIQQIDLLSIDTEGTEIEVLESMNLERHQPKIVIVEFNTAGRELNETELREYFSSLPYDVIHRTMCNLIYQRRSGSIPFAKQ